MENVELENKGKDIEDILKAMDIPCVLQEVVNTQFSERYEFMLKNAKSFSLIPKAITVLKTCFHTNNIELVDSKNDYKGVSRIPFAIEIKTKLNNELEKISIQNLNKDNNFSAFLGIDKNTQPVYIDIQKHQNILIAGAVCSDMQKIINNIIKSLITKNTKETLEFIIFDPKKYIDKNSFSANLLYGESAKDKKISFIRDNYISYDAVTELDNIIEKRKKKKSQNFSQILIIFTDYSEISDWCGERFNNQVKELYNSVKNLKISTIICSQTINSKVLPGELKNYFLTRICFKTNTPAESTFILGNNKASKIQSNDVVIYKDIENSIEKEIRVVKLSEYNKNTKSKPCEIENKNEELPKLIDSYINLKKSHNAELLLKNFFYKNKVLNNFELFCGLSEKQGNHYKLSKQNIEFLEDRNLVNLAKSFSIIINTYNSLKNGKDIFDDYQKIKNEFSSLSEDIIVSIDKETFESLKNLVMLYDSLVGQGLLDSDKDTQNAFYLFAYEMYMEELRIQYDELSDSYNISTRDSEEIIESLYNNDVGIMEIKRYLALREFVKNNNKNYSYELYLQNVESLVEETIKSIKQKRYIENLMKHNNQNDNLVKIADIDLMSGIEFENFVAKLFTKMGYQTRVTKSSGDQGIDVLATKKDYVVAIQAKCYSGVVGNHAIMEAVAGMKYYNANKCMVITNSTFTKSAQELAKVNNVELWDRQILKEKLTGI